MNEDFEPLKETQILHSGFFHWIVERHETYRNRLKGLPFGEWSDDPVLESYKFTNPFRENDTATIWMREHFVTHNPDDMTLSNNVLNAALFRMVGTTQFAREFIDRHGWITQENFSPNLIKEIIQRRIDTKQRCFTGAYIVTNQGIKAPKSEVVIDKFITPLVEGVAGVLPRSLDSNFNLEQLHKWLLLFKGFGGGGFMAYEVVSDVLYMPNIWVKGAVDGRSIPSDRYTWANAGPGALRGLNRIWGRFLTKRMSSTEALAKMKHLLSYKKLIAEVSVERGYKPINPTDIDMRCIEHSLCEYDKYMRVTEGQGRPRSVCKYKEGEVYPVLRGPVE